MATSAARICHERRACHTCGGRPNGAAKAPPGCSLRGGLNMKPRARQLPHEAARATKSAFGWGCRNDLRILLCGSTQGQLQNQQTTLAGPAVRGRAFGSRGSKFLREGKGRLRLRDKPCRPPAPAAVISGCFQATCSAARAWRWKSKHQKTFFSLPASPAFLRWRRGPLWIPGCRRPSSKFCSAGPSWPAQEAIRGAEAWKPLEWSCPHFADLSGS